MPPTILLISGIEQSSRIQILGKPFIYFCRNESNVFYTSKNLIEFLSWGLSETRISVRF